MATRAITTFWDAAASETVRLRTRQLIRLFGIPDGDHIVLKEIRYRSNNDDRNFTMTIDGRQKGQVAAIQGDFDVPAHGQLFFDYENFQNKQRMYDYPVRDEIMLFGDGTGTQWHITWLFDIRDGGMILADDLALNIGDISQVAINRTPGQEYFQPGPINQIGATETPPEV